MNLNHHRRFSIAPMLDWTDRHCRYFHRLLTQHAMLYTEMVNVNAIVHGDRARHLDFDASENPLALQLGGSDVDMLARCARIAQDWGYVEVNINCGCPSERVQSGSFGACLMSEPQLVADGVKAMRDACEIDVTVKHRIGLDKNEHYDFVRDFVGTVADAGCQTFIVHARNAWLKGLSPKENRDVPPLRYEVVHQLKKDFPHLNIITNGGLNTYTAIAEQLQHVDGVMVGREAYQNPGILAAVDREIFGSSDTDADPVAVVRAMYPYIERELSQGTYLGHITRHMLGLFQGIPGARQWRRYLSENAHKAGADINVLEHALKLVADKR